MAAAPNDEKSQNGCASNNHNYGFVEEGIHLLHPRRNFHSFRFWYAMLKFSIHIVAPDGKYPKDLRIYYHTITHLVNPLPKPLISLIFTGVLGIDTI
jgi:hypothetical protein